jgi:hypothetical protein
MTKAALQARLNAAAVGHTLGRHLLAELRDVIETVEGVGPDFDPYLEYLVYCNAAQVLLNEGRRIGGLDFKRGDTELEGRRK